MKEEYADRVSMKVIEGTVEEIGEMVKAYDIDTHGLVGFVGDDIKVRQPGHTWGTTPEKAKGVIEKHIATLLASKP